MRTRRLLLWIRVLGVFGVIGVIGAIPSVRAQSAPTWKDMPALIASATWAIDAELRVCIKRQLPVTIALTATRGRDGKTSVRMPVYGVGQRGYTPEERCLIKAAAKIDLPELPAEIDSLLLAHTIAADQAASDAAFEGWRDPASTIAALVDAKRRAALAACDSRKRTVRVILDRRKDKTRVWLPAWQFHSSKGDGSTPPAERKVKACINKALRDWNPPAMPTGLGELQLALAVAP